MVAHAFSRLEPIEAAATEGSDLERLRDLLDRLDAVDKQPQIAGGEEAIPLPASLQRVLRDALAMLLNGDAIVLTALSRELTTQQAADLLNMSRQHLVDLLENGAIRFHKAGTHRRILLSDVLEYRERRFLEQEAALDEIARLSLDAGMYRD